MGDWVGKEYQLILPIKNVSAPAILNESLFSLKRVGYLDVLINSGSMPPGIERLQKASVIIIAGTVTHGLEGPLPERFWHVRTRLLILANMGPQFTGRLEDELPFCEHLDYRLYLWRMPKFSGSISGLEACTKINDAVFVVDVPLLVGNAWSTVLRFSLAKNFVRILGGNFSGPIPFAEGSGEGDVDPWVQWCQAHLTPGLQLWVEQDVNGPLPFGLNACSDILREFRVSRSGLTGSFPINFSRSMSMDSQGLDVSYNRLTGPIPDVPPQTTVVGIRDNIWSGDVPQSWSLAAGLTVLDLTSCSMSGPLPNLTASIEVVSLAGNRFEGPAPKSWFFGEFERDRPSGNHIVGPPFSWGWTGSDTNDNFDQATFLSVYRESPPWPLKSVKLDHNALGISVGFLMAMLSYYQLEAVSATNCALHGFISPYDLAPRRGLQSSRRFRACKAEGVGSIPQPDD
jgi:hypothetical protein